MSEASELYACLYAREFPAQALLRLRPELRGKPCVVMEGEPPMQQVCSLNAKAKALGIEHGMTRVEVDTFPAVTVLPRSHAEEDAARAAVLECAGAFSPRIEDQSTDSSLLCVLDIAGTEKLLGAPQELAKALLQRVKALGFRALVAVSGNFHAAISLARGMAETNRVRVIPRGDESLVLSSLPLSVLDLTAQQAETLSLWGIHTLGMLAALPEQALIARMGQDAKRLLQRSRGELPHLFRPVEPGFHLEERMELDTPVELLDSLLFVIGLMLEQVILRATARIFALASVTVALSLEGEATHARTVKPALPTNDRHVWLKLIHLDLEAHPPQAAILALTLTAEHGVTSKVQLGLFSPQLPEPMRLDVTLARIRAIVGEEQVGHAALRDTHRLDGFIMEAFTVPANKSRPSAQTVTKQPSAAVRRIRPAESIPVKLCGRKPDSFSFRGLWYAVEHAYGPWIVSGDWWNPTLWSNEQWDLVARADDGAMLCCCLVLDRASNTWQMVALYD
jgi:protein ImuB